MPIERNSLYTRAVFRQPPRHLRSPDYGHGGFDVVNAERAAAEQGSLALLEALKGYAAKHHPGALG